MIQLRQLNQRIVKIARERAGRVVQESRGDRRILISWAPLPSPREPLTREPRHHFTRLSARRRARRVLIPETTTVQQPSHRLVDRAPVTDGDRIARPRQGACRIWFACSFGDSVPARLPDCLLCAALTWAEAWSRDSRVNGGSSRR